MSQNATMINTMGYPPGEASSSVLYPPSFAAHPRLSTIKPHPDGKGAAIYGQNMIDPFVISDPWQKGKGQIISPRTYAAPYHNKLDSEMSNMF